MKFRNRRRDQNAFPDVVIHIGAPKCGSSAIQRFCVSHRDALLKLGYFYPEHSLDVNGVSGGHTQVAGALISNKRKQAHATFQRWLNEAKAQRACLLLSAEAFYGRHAAMAEFCEGLDVTVIGFLRHPIEYLLGNHNQGIKRHMSTRRLGDLLPEVLGKPTGQLVGEPLLKWADAVGDDNCIFIPFFSPENGGPLAEVRLMKALGIETPMAPLLQEVGGQTNRSYVKLALELKRLLNTVLDDLSAHSAHQVDWSLQGYSDRAHHESGYTLADLPAEVCQRLEEQLLRQMAPVLKRFPQLAPVAEMPATAAGNTAAKWMDLAGPLAALQADAPTVLQEIHARAIELRNQGRQDYAFCKLLDLLGVEFHERVENTQQAGLSVQQRKQLSNDKAEEADILREMALLLERQGLLDDAWFAISCALDRRPNGLGIQRIKARIGEKLEAGRQVAASGSAQTSKLSE